VASLGLDANDDGVGLVGRAAKLMLQRGDELERVQRHHAVVVVARGQLQGSQKGKGVGAGRVGYAHLTQTGCRASYQGGRVLDALLMLDIVEGGVLDKPLELLWLVTAAKVGRPGVTLKNEIEKKREGQKAKEVWAPRKICTEHPIKDLTGSSYPPMVNL